MPDVAASILPSAGISSSPMSPTFVRTVENAFLASTAVVVGDVTIGEGSSVWFGAVVRGDVAPVRIGRRVNVQDNSVIHCDAGVENAIEDDVTIGHGAIVHGAHSSGRAR